MFVNYCRFNAESYGAWPEYGFSHARGAENPNGFVFQAPNLSLHSDVDADRFNERLGLLGTIGYQRASLDRVAENEPFDRYRQRAISLLADPKTQKAFNVADADPKLLERYGRNTFGWSLLIARQLVEAGVSMIQVNLGNDETWDTHVNAFPLLKDFLFPPTDRAVSALLDDLAERGLLDSTLIVMAGEMGRTPKISTLPQFSGKPGARPLGYPNRLLRRRRSSRRHGNRLDRQNWGLSGGESAKARKHGRHKFTRRWEFPAR
jgi:hypothetical protein